ncbi:Electron transport complex protein RnfG [Pseudoalteromonas luteoviolacea B = ATCC 29581]|nr:Electron transport complex protein RnfG [Pseudoalteromonas luteoviolacea B = ATCC 29581]
MIFQSMSRNGLILMGFALATTAAVALVNELTKPKIAEQNRLQLQKLLTDVLSADKFNNILVQDCVRSSDPALGPEGVYTIYRARLDNEPVALVMQHTSKDGYSGTIDMITAIERSGRISGVRVTHHEETPGLGDKVEPAKSDWILHFSGQALTSSNDPKFKVKRDGGDFDQFTGATITPRAVVNSVAAAVWFGQQNFATIFTLPNECGVMTNE